MNKINLFDISIIIPVKIDHENRRENLKTIIAFFNKYFEEYELIILEHSSQQNCKFLEEHSNIKYSYKQVDGLMHRTQMLNDGVKSSNRRFIASYDTDVIFYPETIDLTMKMLRDGHSFVYPYNGVFIEITGTLQNKYMESLDHSILPRHNANVELYTRGEDYQIVHNRGLGGAVFFERNTFLMYGGYNKKFISWGYEDNELISRFTKIGINVCRPGECHCIYHLSHFRGIDSSPGQPHEKQNMSEYAKVNAMPKNVLLKYIYDELL